MKFALSRKNLWSLAPRPVRAAAGYVLALVPVPYLIGRAFRRELNFIETAQWWRAARAREYQMAQLRRICGLAYDRTPYYRHLFDRARVDPRSLTSDSLRAVPLLDAAAVREHLDEMCAVRSGSPGVDYVTTGGTGGHPLRFYMNASRSQVEFAYLVSGWRRAGYGVGTTLAVLRGRAVDADGTGIRHEFDRPLRQHYYSSFHLQDEHLHRVLDHIRGIGPCFLHVYPSSVTALARFIVRSGAAVPSNIQGILAESEILYPEQRQLVERTFGLRCFTSYGLTEKVAAAAECEHTTDYHVWPTYGYVELLDDDGAPVTAPGAAGEIVATGFINTAVPFIRYRTGDRAIYVGDRCDRCGREHPILADIRGHRVQEVLITADGSAISWTALNMHDDTFDRVERFQFRQDVPGRATLRIVPAQGFTDYNRQRIEERVARKIAGRIDVLLEMVDAIPLTPAGKAIYVDQRIAAAGAAASAVDDDRGGVPPAATASHDAAGRGR